jgi:hypothetical protein
MVNAPLASVTTVCSPVAAGLVAVTRAPTTGLPVEPSVTTPVMVPVVCADATPAKSSASGARRASCINFFFMTTSRGECTR